MKKKSEEKNKREEIKPISLYLFSKIKNEEITHHYFMWPGNSRNENKVKIVKKKKKIRLLFLINIDKNINNKIIITVYRGRVEDLVSSPKLIDDRPPGRHTNAICLQESSCLWNYCLNKMYLVRISSDIYKQKQSATLGSQGNSVVCIS